MARHVDFEKIRAAFLAHYSKDPAFGESRYVEWVKDSGLDESKSYYVQAAALCKCKQSFQWAQFLIEFVKEDQEAKYYKVEALFPVESMNGAVFTHDEVLQSARSLTGKPSNLNHDPKQMLREVEVVAAQCEDDCVECLVRILKSSPVIGMIERKEIVNVSVEGDWSHGIPGQGLVLTGLGWLTKDAKLPGIPLTRIMPVEHIVESFTKAAKVGASVKVSVETFSRWNLPKVRFVCRGPNPCARCKALDGEEFVFGTEPDLPLHDGCQCGYDRVAEGLVQGQACDDVFCVFCSNPADFFVSICEPCFGKLAPDVSVSSDSKYSVHSNGVESLEEKDVDAIAEKVAAKVSVKESAEVTKLTGDLAEAKSKVAEVEGKLKTAEDTLGESAGKLEAANKLAEDLRKQVPGGGLLVNPPKMMPISEAVMLLEGVLPAQMVERSAGLGMQRMCQEMRGSILKLKARM